VIVLPPGTTVISNYLTRIGSDQRYEISFTNITGTVDIEQGDAGTRCESSRHLMARLTSGRQTLHLPDAGGQAELCAVVAAGTPTMVISPEPFDLR